MIYTLMTWSILPVSMSEKCVAGGSVVVEILTSLLKSHWWSSVVTRKPHCMSGDLKSTLIFVALQWDSGQYSLYRMLLLEALIHRLLLLWTLCVWISQVMLYKGGSHWSWVTHTQPLSLEENWKHGGHPSKVIFRYSCTCKIESLTDSGSGNSEMGTFWAVKTNVSFPSLWFVNIV